jgi:hypothetical protein
LQSPVTVLAVEIAIIHAQADLKPIGMARGLVPGGGTSR